jgi:hypothetical protein
MSLRVTRTFHIDHSGRSGEIRRGSEPPPPRGRTPRITKLMALALKFERMLQCGEVKYYVELARLGHVTRARITQIMNLLLLAPDIQEEILFLPEVKQGRAPVTIIDLQPIAVTLVWSAQRVRWRALMDRA